MLGGEDYKIINAVYHPVFKAKLPETYAPFDLGILVVSLMISLIALIHNKNYKY